MKRKILISLPVLFLITGCEILSPFKNKDSSTSEGTSSSNNSQLSSSSSSSQNNINGQSKTFDFTNVFTGAGGIKVINKTTEFLTYLNASGNYVSSIDVDEYVTFQPCFSDSGEQLGLSLLVGTSSSGGTITFNFVNDIKSISFTIQGYHKYYSSTWNLDAGSHIDIEGNGYNLGSTDTDHAPTRVNDLITFNPAKKFITFSNDNDHQRAFIHNLTIVY